MEQAKSHPLRWLYLDLNSFFASVEQQQNPALRGRPVAIGPERINSGTIIAASYEAKAYGIKTGMRVAEARERCPGLVFAGSDHGRYVHYHNLILAEVERHIPVTQVCSIDEVACRLLNNENSPAQATDLARRIKAGIHANVGECLTSSIGIAPSRLLAKIATDMMKPDGLVVLQSADLPHALLPLSLRDIPGIGPRMEARLNARGIFTMAQLLSQDPKSAGQLWGSVLGARLWYALQGEDFPDPPRKSKSIGHSHVLAPDQRNPEAARLVCRKLVTKAAARLREGGHVARTLSFHVRFESRYNWSTQCKFEPTDDSFPMLLAFNGLWSNFQTFLGQLPHPPKIKLVGVSLDDVKPAATSQAAGQQLDLFEPQTKPPTRAIVEAMDQIQAKFGRNSISLGPAPKDRSQLIGSKIAFGRIPDSSEFE